VRTSLLLLFLLSTTVAVVSAQPSPPGATSPADTSSETTSEPTSSLTISQALALAEKNSPALAESAASVSRAEAGIQSAKAYTNPSFEFLGGHQSARSIATPGVPGALLHYSGSQTIEIPHERRTRIGTAKLELEGTEYRSVSVRLAVAADVKRVFYDVVRRKEQLAQARDNLTLVEDLRRRVQMEVQVGEKGKLELTRAEAELARAQSAVRSANVELASARALLKAAIGSSSDDLFDAKGSLVEAPVMQSLHEMRTRILAEHPALKQASTQTQQAQLAIEHEQARRIPEPTVYGEYERQPDISFYRFGVTVPLPLWDRRKGPIAEAQAEAKRTQAAANQVRLQLMAALERAYDQYQISNEQVKSLEAGSLHEAEAAVDAARAAYRFGERGIVEVLDAQRVLQGVRSDLLDAQYARQSALIDLEELGAVSQ
ncbi:MAG TPA: TolC family protein, partial [Acidobacteriaceae bacterium]|nr:TolC family protein [Acidobacteriaceae bacterium]